MRPFIAEAADAQASDGLPRALELGPKDMTGVARTVWVARLAPGLWLHTTTSLIDLGFYYPANGLILERASGALLIDTGYLPEQAETLPDWSKQHLSSPISEAVCTHFHNDRTGGISGLQRHGITTRALPLTCELARTHGLSVPQPIETSPAGRHRARR